MVDNPRVDWNPWTNELRPAAEKNSDFALKALTTKDAKERKGNQREPDTRYAMLLKTFQASLLNAQNKPSVDIWTSTRASTSDSWSPPVNIDANPLGTAVCAGMPPVLSNVNTGRHDGKPSLSFDGTKLYFGAAQRPGNFGVGCPYAATCFFDIWVATREKLKESN